MLFLFENLQAVIDSVDSMCLKPENVTFVMYENCIGFKLGDIGVLPLVYLEDINTKC